MTNDIEIEKIIAALKQTLRGLEIADYYDALNALSNVLIETLTNNEYISKPAAYQLAGTTFTDFAKKLAIPPPPPRPPTKREFFELRQRRIAARVRTRQRRARRACKAGGEDES
jgi:hypothetical protein